MHFGTTCDGSVIKTSSLLHPKPHLIQIFIAKHQTYGRCHINETHFNLMKMEAANITLIK